VDPTNEGNIAFVNIFVAEGGRAENNPVNTTQPEPGATPYNTFDGSLHVWNYPTMDEGLTAIAATFNNGLNQAVLAALRNKEDASHITAVIATASSWDSAGTLYIDTLPGTKANFPTLAAVEVAPSTGTGPVSVPAPVPVPTPTEAPAVTDIPIEPTTTETGKVEDAVAAQTKAVDAAAVAGKASVLRQLVTELETHLSELEDLVK
jgi:hypothetical protein